MDFEKIVLAIVALFLVAALLYLLWGFLIFFLKILIAVLIIIAIIWIYFKLRK